MNIIPYLVMVLEICQTLEGLPALSKEIMKTAETSP